MKQFIRVCCIVAVLALAGCLESTPPAIGAAESNQYAGIMGHWRHVYNKENLYIRVNPDMSFHTGSDPRDLKDEVRMGWLNHYTFVAELIKKNANNQPKGQMYFGHHVPNYLVVYTNILDEDHRRAANETGLKIKKSGLYYEVAPGQPKELLFRTFETIAKSTVPGTSQIYEFVGGFVEPDNPKASISEVARLYKAGKEQESIEMARYLSDRGDALAQKFLMLMGAEGDIHRGEAIRHGLRGAASIYAAHATLAKLYAMSEPRATAQDVNTELRHAYYWARRASHTSDNKLASEILNKLCDSPIDKTKSPKDCRTLETNAVTRSIRVQAAMTHMIALRARIKITN